MTNQPLFSVLIANYNNGKYLMDAIKSVHRQTYTNWEIILVDDSSTDNSHELYKELEQDERIHIYLNDQNHGCGYTKHRCVELANGEICGFLDPDDELLPNALKDSADALLSDVSKVLCFSRFYQCDENMNIQGEYRLLRLNGVSYFENHDYCPEHFASFRTSAYREMGGIDIMIQAGVDQDLYFRLEEVGEVVVINKFTYKYRKNPTALTSVPYWCVYWNLWVRHNTCVRRGLSIKKYPYADFTAVLNDLAKDIIEHNSNFIIEKIVESRMKTELYKQELLIRSASAYRLGSFILKPIKKLKKLLKI